MLNAENIAYTFLMMHIEEHVKIPSAPTSLLVIKYHIYK